MLPPLPPQKTSLYRPGTGASLQSLLHYCGIFLLRGAGDVKEGSNGGCRAQTKSKHPDFSSNSSWLTMTWREVNVYGPPGLLKGISILTELGARAYPLRPFKSGIRASLVAQWLRICLLMQGTRVRALVWEDPTCRGAAGPVSHNC